MLSTAEPLSLAEPCIVSIRTLVGTPYFQYQKYLNIEKCKLECVNKLIQELKYCKQFWSSAEPLSLRKPRKFTMQPLLVSILPISKTSQQWFEKLMQVLKHCENLLSPAETLPSSELYILSHLYFISQYCVHGNLWIISTSSGWQTVF